MAVGGAVSLARAGGHGDGGFFKLAAKLFFQFFGQLTHNAQAARVIDDKPVLDHLGKAHGAGHRLFGGIDDDNDDVGRAKVNAHIKRLCRADLERLDAALVQFGHEFVGGGKVHVSLCCVR